MLAAKDFIQHSKNCQICRQLNIDNSNILKDGKIETGMNAIRKELPSVEDLQEVVTKLRGEIDALRQEHSDEQ